MAIKFALGRGDFTSLGGLNIFSRLYDDLGISKKVRDLMPGQHSKRIVKRNLLKFKSLTHGFIAGAECLDDMDKLNDDIGFAMPTQGKTFHSVTFGKFLRKFFEKDLEKLNEVLRQSALKLRMACFPEDNDFIIDLDSTSHRHYGKTKEGLAWNYKKEWCLDSIQAFDQKGFKYWDEVRAGNTHTSVRGGFIVRKVFSNIPLKLIRYLRADSGYCNNEIFIACIDRDVKFVIAMKENMYKPLLERIHSKFVPTKHTFMRDGRKCEIAHTVYYPKGLNGRDCTLRVVIIRAKKEVPDLFDEYDYRAFVTNIGTHEMQDEKIVDFYKPRGNAENFIREMKNGFDLKHFPCRSLNANNVYSIIAAIAHNLFRFHSWKLKRESPHFSKILRFRMVYIAGQVVKKARNIHILLSKHKLQEVNHWLTTHKLQIGTG